MKLADTLKAIFLPYYNSPEGVWESFVERGELVEFAKNDIIKKANHRELYFNFILKGAGGIFIENYNNLICIDLCLDETVFCDYLSLLTDETTPLALICLEATTIFRIPQAQFQILTATPHGQIFTKIAAEQLFIHKQTQQLEILTKTAKQRYIELIDKQPFILQRVPSKYIASYLGITPESLSRIKKEITK